ncbi:PD-(D/E)XK nuclease family protein [Collinsella sp. AGMB00827]|uniref:PD-(D/E)XK nuclease family protein n=2 Tax=Collinsella ureilytica TaxID=2869515 RepID=A0ABS7MLH9_9ACTN|nr:PD-(D/E)XK nuclease family protein [Collinsella urealyticum]
MSVPDAESVDGRASSESNPALIDLVEVWPQERESQGMSASSVGTSHSSLGMSASSVGTSHIPGGLFGDFAQSQGLPGQPAGSSSSKHLTAPSKHVQDMNRVPSSSGAQDLGARQGNPVALGSAFHAAAQWMLEMECDQVPADRLDALSRLWRITPEQRERLEHALVLWSGSSVRAEALAWPCVRAEVPFFSLGATELAAYGTWAEGAIDLLATDPDDPRRALVIDYKTGGSLEETPDELQQKHLLQAKVYADVLKRAGWNQIDLKFVRVELEDPDLPGEPQVVSYRM